MIDLAEIGRLTFTQPGDFSRLENVLSEVASYAEARTAAEVVALLQQKSAGTSADSAKLAPYIAKFRSLALPVLTDEQVRSIFSSLVAVLSDERIGLYERLHARLLVLPETRRTPFANGLLEVLRGSNETLAGQTVSAWVKRFDQSQAVTNPDALFRQPDFKALDDRVDHAVRHLLHIVTLLQTGEQTTPPAARPVAETKEPVAPPNLPVEIKPVSPAPVPATPATDRGPTVAAVIQRMHQNDASAGTDRSAIEHLTPDDEQEIALHTKELAGLNAGPNVHDTIGGTITTVIQDLHLNFTDENLRRRFETIFTAQVKEIRNPNETLDLLMRSEKVGGLGMNPETAERVIQAAKIAAAKFKTEDGVRELAQKQTQAVPMPKPPKVPSALPGPVTPLPPKPVAPPPTLVQAQPRAVFVQPATSIPVRQNLPPTRMPVQPARPMPPPTFAASLRTATVERPTVSDIRGSSRLVGPVEELRTMTLTDYRRLGPDPISVIRRVYEKIQRLGKESFTKRAEGIQAWRQADVYKLYLSIGQESLASNRTVRDVALTRQQLGQPSLSEQEFTLIADLNRKLRF